MNRETIVALHEVKQAMLQQETLALRQISIRLDAAQAERDALIEGMDRAEGDGSISATMAATRYRLFKKQALVRLVDKIDRIEAEYGTAEETLTMTFAEVRAIERLKDG